jgi:hypothetical protein
MSPVADDFGDGATGHHAVGFDGGPISRAMHPGTVGRIERDVAHAQQGLAVLRLRHRAVDHLEMFRAELAAGLFHQKNLAIDAAAHGVSPSLV